MLADTTDHASGRLEKRQPKRKMRCFREGRARPVVETRLIKSLAVLAVLLFCSYNFKHVYVHGADSLRASPYSSYFNNPYDYADAESYGTNVFQNLIRHMNAIKREKDMCGNIPLPKTVLAQKYFNPMYEFLNYKFWYPPRDHHYVILWSQLESYRNSLFLSYMLQDENAKFPPGWLYMYLSTAAQLHSLQMIGFNSHKSVKAIKLPFESNEVFKVNWWTNGNYQKFEKPFLLYATQLKLDDPRSVKVVDVGTGNYSNDYTGHAFLGNYLYDRQQFLLNNTYEYSNYWRRPYQEQLQHQHYNQLYEQTNRELNQNQKLLDLNLNKPISPNDPLYQKQVELTQQKKFQEDMLLYQQQQLLLQQQFHQPMPYGAQNYVVKSPYDQLPVAGEYPQYPMDPPYLQHLPSQSPQPYDTSLTDSRYYPTYQQYYHQGQYLQQQLGYNNLYQQQQPYHGNYLPFNQQRPIVSIDQLSPFIYLNKNNIPITSWDPLIDNEKNNLNRIPDKNTPIGFDQWYLNNIVQSTAFETIKNSNENPFILKNISYIETYRYAKPWWNNETDKNIFDNTQEYVFRIKPEERYYKFTGAKYEGGTSWSAPYFWCIDPRNWLVSSKSPIWATNDMQYRNKLFANSKQHRFVGLSEVVLNFEELDVNQCPGERQLTAFSSTALCDSTTECLPLAGYGLNQGGYECHCLGGFRYPDNFNGPFRGKELANFNPNTYPLCIKSEALLQFPNWVSKNAIEFQVPNTATSYSELKSVDDIVWKRKKRESPADLLNRIKWNRKTRGKKPSETPRKRSKRFLDKRNNFEKLRDAIFGDQTLLRKRCISAPLQDVIKLNEDDERFINQLRLHANMAFKPQIAQAVRIAHILSSYIQLHSPVGYSSAGSQNDYSATNNVASILRPDPQLDEIYLVGEIMSTLLAHYPIQDVNVFFNGTEFTRQKSFAGQNVLSIGLSAIRSEVEMFLNRSNDNSHLTKTWYMDAINRFTYSTYKPNYGGYYDNDHEKSFFQSAGPLDSNILASNDFKFERFSIDMSLRRTFDGLQGNVELPTKFYDAPTSGVWFGPFYDCQKRYMKTKTTLRMTYSVPIITSSTKLPVGFVSVGIGSDLKWWRINPCETTKERNMFQGLHRCDAETTMCMHQPVPDYESGYYLASYRCMCKANYEFPFIDYGSSFFEGATVEKEYEKKIKGQPNIYDRLKCRPVLRSLTSVKRNNWGWPSAAPATIKPSLVHIYMAFFIIFMSSFKL